MYGLKEEHINTIQSIFEKYLEIDEAILYGSRAKGNYRNGSDIDLTLKGEKLNLSVLSQIQIELEDTYLPYQVDLSIYHTIENPKLIEHIDRVGISFYKNKTMNEWREYKLDDFISINPTERIAKGTLAKKIAMETLQPFTKKITDFSKEEYKGGTKFRNGDTIMARITPSLENGKTSFVDILDDEEIGFGSTEFIVFREIKDVSDKNFIYYLTISPIVRNIAIKSMTGSSGRQRVQTDVLRNYEVFLPPLSEQKAIASVLSSLDDKIDVLHRQNETLEQMAETLFRQWFVEEADDSWEEKPLSSIATFLNGLACQKYPPKNNIEKLPVLKIKELRNGLSDDSDWVTTEVSPEYIIENGDVIFSWSASLMVKIWDGKKCILNQHLFKVTSEQYPKWYYYLWCKFHLEQFIAIARAHATTMGHIKRKDLDEAMVLVPTENELTSMGNHINPLMEKIILNNKQLSNLTAIRDTLLPKLMSGEVRVK